MSRKLAFPVIVALVLSCLITGILPSGFADSEPGAPPADTLAIKVEMPDSSYILGSGDELAIEDVNIGKLTTGKTKILADGTVDLPLIGEIALAGLSMDAAQILLNEKYKVYYLEPSITIQILTPHPVRVYVRGAVNNPGVYVSGKNTGPSSNGRYELGSSSVHFFSHQFYLTDALIEAGGVTHNADLKDVVIQRTFPKPQTIHVNLWALMKLGETIQDLPLHEQDIIQVSGLPQDAKNALVHHDEWKQISGTNITQNLFPVNVIGAVKQPGSYQISGTDNVLQAIAMAGGFSEMANQSNVYILRTNAAGQVFKTQVNASDSRLMGRNHGKKARQDWMALLPEDVIFVDESTGKKALEASRNLFDRATGAAMLPFFNSIVNPN
ncbi:MAG TPA: SLBB domain-containing protein [Coleofasciculaceae cyanobacterium]|jgi:polysaccharide export outer membrane protein